MFTADPTFTWVPAVGLSLITLPAGSVLLDAVFTVPRTRPTFVMAVVAAACVRPTTFGTATCPGPVDTTRLTADPTFTCVPAVGLSLITLPAGTVLLDAVVTVPSTSPALVMTVVAAACVRPTTFGTATCPGPVDTTRFTADPTFTWVPAVGLSLITLPAGTVLLDAVVTVPSTNPALVMAVVAAAAVRPTTFGTATCPGPVDTTRFTADPTFTWVPAVGLSLITLPAGTVLLDAVVTVPSTNPALVMAV